MLLQYKTKPHRWPQFVRDLPAEYVKALSFDMSASKDIETVFLRSVKAPSGLNALTGEDSMAVEFAIKNKRATPILFMEGEVTVIDARGQKKLSRFKFDDGMEIVPANSTKGVILPITFPSILPDAKANVVLIGAK